MTAMETAVETKRTWNKMLLPMLMGAVLGMVVGGGFIKLISLLHYSPKTLGRSNALTLYLGVVYVASAIAMWLVSLNRKRLAKTLEGNDDALPATNEEIDNFRTNAAVVALAGLLLTTPFFASPWLGAKPWMPGLVYGCIVAGFAVQTALNLAIWRRSDEYVRRMILTGTAVTFWIGQGTLFLWAAAERLHLVRAIPAWDLLIVLMALYLLINMALSMRHSR